MAARRFIGPQGAQNAKSTLNEMLDFGPDSADAPPARPPAEDITSRLRNIVKQMQEISKRIDNLTGKY